MYFVCTNRCWHNRYRYGLHLQWNSLCFNYRNERTMLFVEVHVCLN